MLISLWVKRLLGTWFISAPNKLVYNVLRSYFLNKTMR